MNEIKRQVRRAHRRMIWQQFVGVLPWSLFFFLLAAVVAIAVTKIWPLGVDGVVWAQAWIGGAAVGGLLLAVVWTCFARVAHLDAAIEIDRRYALKERVSSTVALADEDLETDVGRALLDDTLRKVARIDLAERFQVSANWKAILPVLAAAAAFALVLLVEDASRRQAAASQSEQQIKRIDKSALELKKKMLAQAKKAEEEGLKDAAMLFRKFEKGIDELKISEREDPQRAMIKLNDLAKELEQRRRELGGAEQIERRFERLKSGLSGPAGKIAKAMKQGDFRDAVSELEKLKEKLQKGELSEQEKQELARQMEEMSQKLKQAVDEYEQAKQNLERQIKEKLDSGDLAEAGRLQQKLDRLNEQAPQMSRLQQMASTLGQCGQSLQKGNSGQASDMLDQLAGELESLQSELDELETLDGAMSQIAQAKAAMNCEHCGGGG